MASFEEIMNKPASEIKAPAAYPVGTYHCMVDGPPEYGKSSQKQTDFWKFKFKILSPQSDVNAEEAATSQVTGKTVTAEYYVTEASAWRFKELLVHLGCLESEDDSTPLTEALAGAPGKQLYVKLKHEVSDDGKRVFHRVQSTAAV